jgi:hypothetical protein
MSNYQANAEVGSPCKTLNLIYPMFVSQLRIRSFDFEQLYQFLSPVHDNSLIVLFYRNVPTTQAQLIGTLLLLLN